MNNIFENQLETLRQLLKETSLNANIQVMYLEKIRNQGYLDEQTKAELIDILNQENILLKNDLYATSEESLQNLTQITKELSHLEEEGEKLTKQKEELKNLKSELLLVAKSNLSDEEKKQKYDQIKAKYEDLFKF